jgi:hypothetical protein
MSVNVTEMSPYGIPIMDTGTTELSKVASEWVAGVEFQTFVSTRYLRRSIECRRFARWEKNKSEHTHTEKRCDTQEKEPMSYSGIR